MQRIALIVVMLVLPVGLHAIGQAPPDEPYVEVTFRITHEPPATCNPYEQLFLTATVEAPAPEQLEVMVHVRTMGSDGPFYDLPMEMLSLNHFQATIPARLVSRSGIEYYIDARMGLGFTSSGSSQTPYQLPSGYAYEGETPSILPGDDVLLSLDPRLVPMDSSLIVPEIPEEGERSTLPLQILVVLVVIVIAAVIYQRMGQ